MSTPSACGAPPRWARQRLPRQSGSLGRGPLGSSTVIGEFLCLGSLVRASRERGVGAHTAADVPGSLLRVAPYGVGKSHCPPGAAVAHPLSTLRSVPALDMRGMTVTHLSPAATCGPWDPRSPSGGTGRKCLLHPVLPHRLPGIKGWQLCTVTHGTARQAAEPPSRPPFACFPLQARAGRSP